MINSNELNISNKSYTKKDFAQIYPELLDLVKKLTSKWDPSQSNESDPGVILLKLCAFIADKNNYSIDKNILECFMPSATQESSMRTLCDMQGYEMSYYKSAIIKPTFKYIESKAEDAVKLENDIILLPKFTTVLTDTDNSYKYTLLEDIELSKNLPTGNAYTLGAIEGIIEKLYINNSDLIQLSNLDQNNRIYLPSVYAAQNGCFIYAGTEKFEKVLNLNICDLNSYVFKFGYSSEKGLPYVEFPNWISTIIGDGLTIYYTISSGQNGNISNTTLSTFLDMKEIKISENKSISVDNISISCLKVTDGYDPESIDSAYNNFKKQVGTFNTLITCRDYMNYIYNMLNEDNSRYVSNILVTDRRTDLNYSSEIVTLDNYGEYSITRSDKDSENNDYLSASDIVLYPLNRYKNLHTYEDYSNSFQPLSDKELNHLERKIESLADDIISNVSCISRDYKKLNDKDIYCLKNYYNLNIKIGTTEKVNALQQKEIIDNVKKALYKNFNAGKVDYGYEIPYDSLLTVIERSDARVKSVLLDEPELETYVLYKDGSEELLDDNHYITLKIAAKNILSGRINLYEYNNVYDLDYDYVNILGQEPEIPVLIENIQSITTHTQINIVEPQPKYIEYPESDSYTVSLKENEYIQFIVPSFTTLSNYAYGVNYKVCFDGNESKIIPANQIYKLKAGESIKINYTNTNGNPINHVLTQGQVIRATFPLKHTSTDTATITKNGEPYNQLGIEDKIELVDQTKIVIDNKKVECFWKVNSTNNALFTQGKSKRILNENEYFIYKQDDDLLQILGSGTILYVDEEAAKEDWSLITNLSLNQSNIDSTSLITKDFSSYNLTIQDASIYTLTKDDICIINRFPFGEDNGEGNDIMPYFRSITNNLNSLNKPCFAYKLSTDTEFSEVASIDPSVAHIEVRSRLDLNSGPKLFQKISNDGYSFQDVEIKTADGNTFNLTSNNPIYFKFNNLIQLPGGENLDMGVTYVSADSIESSYDLSVLVLTKNSDIQEPYIKGSTKKLTNSSNTFVTSLPSIENNDYIIPIHVTGLKEGETLKLETSNISNISHSNKFKIHSYNTHSAAEQSGANIMLISSNHLAYATKDSDRIIVEYDNTLGLYKAVGAQIHSASVSAINSNQYMIVSYPSASFDQNDKESSDYLCSLAQSIKEGNNAYFDLVIPESATGNWNYISQGWLETLSDEINLNNNLNNIYINVSNLEPIELKLIYTGNSEIDIYLDNPLLIEGYNAKFNFKNILRILDNISYLDPDKLYNYTFNQDNLKLLDKKHLNKPESLWDVNNKANIFTLPYLNLNPKSTKTSISILRSSKI